MATERLYYTDSYLTDFEAAITSRSEDGRGVSLDRTAFYPTSGGQPHDLGTLNGEQVLNVTGDGENVMHWVASPLTGDSVRGAIDWNRRYDHMQQHTGQHLLSAVFSELFGYETLSFHLGAEASTIELATRELTDAHADRAEGEANETARKNIPVLVRFENAETAGGLRKPSNRAGRLRIIEIEGRDRSACGGTHVRSTTELLPIQIRGTEKIRGNLRVEFVCGRRATTRAKQDFRALTELARLAAAPLDSVPARVHAVTKRLADAEKLTQRLRGEIGRREGQALYRDTPASPDGIRRLMLKVASLDDEQRALVQAYSEQGRAAVLLTTTELPLRVLIACSPDSGLNVGMILKETAALTGGRGGGSAVGAQGSLPNAEAVEKLSRALGFSPDDHRGTPQT